MASQLRAIDASVAEAPRSSRGVSLRGFAERFGPWLLTALLIGFWEFAVRFFEVPTFLLPTPSQIVALMYKEWPLLQMHGTATVPAWSRAMSAR